MNVISLFHSLLYKDNNCINMEKYPFYYIASVPLCLPSFFVVFRVIKNKFLKSVFNQQITLMLLLNGNNLKGWVFDIFLGKSLNSSSRLILPTDPKGPHFVSGLSPRLSPILKKKKDPNLAILLGLYVVLTFSLSLYILLESGEMSLPCMILINLRTSYLVSIMACGTVAVMFRLVSLISSFSTLLQKLNHFF